MSRESQLAQLQEINVDDIQEFLLTRHSDKVPDDLQEYVLQMDTVARIMHQNRLSVRQAIRQLRIEWPELTQAMARRIYYDALDYYYFDDNSSAKAWDSVYADQLDDLKLLAIKSDKLEIAYKCMAKAHELRTKVRESENHHWQAPVFMINVNVRPEDLGFASQKLADIAKRAEDRELAQMISGLETTDKEKARLFKDAGIEEVDYQKEEEDEEDS